MLPRASLCCVAAVQQEGGHEGGHVQRGAAQHGRAPLGQHALALTIFFKYFYNIFIVSKIYNIFHPSVDRECGKVDVDVYYFHNCMKEIIFPSSIYCSINLIKDLHRNPMQAYLSE